MFENVAALLKVDGEKLWVETEQKKQVSENLSKQPSSAPKWLPLDLGDLSKAVGF